MGKRNHTMQNKNGQQKQLLTVLVLSSILGMGLYAAPVQAKSITEGTGDAYAVQTTDGTAAEGGILQISGTAALEHAYGGYAVKGGNAQNNTLSITGGSTIYGYGGYTTSGNVSKNTVMIGTEGTKVVDSGLTFGPGAKSDAVSVYGGYTGSGVASNNQVTVTGTTINSAIYSGYTGSGDATNNTVNLTNSAIVNGTYESRSDVYGGYSAGTTGTVSGNSIIVDGTTSKGGSYYGGYAAGGTVTTNTVTMQNASSVTQYNYVNKEGSSSYKAGNTYGGYNAKGDATYNVVNLKSGSVTDGKVYGGYATKGNASYNTITFDASTLKHYYSGEPFRSFVYGGYGENGGADHNTVKILNGSSIGENVYGGYANGWVSNRSANANYNTITMVDSTSSANLYGALSGAGVTTNHNLVTLSNSQVTGSEIYGSYNRSPNAEYNTVILEKGSSAKSIYGSMNYQGSASYNTLIIASGVAKDESGSALLSGEATSSKWDGTTRTAVNGSVYGGYTQMNSGSASGNSIHITDADIKYSVYGGYTLNDGSISGNKIILDGSTDVKQTVYGGLAKNRESDVTREMASGNKVTVTGEAKVENTNKASLGNIVGGYTNLGNVDGNTVTVDSMAGQSGLVIVGGYTYQGNARALTNTWGFLGNVVTLAGNSSYSKVTGGYTNSGDAINNQVILDGKDKATFASVYGGYTATGNANENTITVQNNADTRELLYAGYSETGTANSNQLIITKGTGIQGYAGYTKKGEASGNGVTVTEGTLGATVIAGYTESGNANENTITLNGGTEASQENILYAGKTADGTAAGNKITVNSAAAAVGTLIAGAANGAANENTITLTQGTVQTAMAGQSTEAGASGNKLYVSGGTLTGTGYAGYAEAGAANTNLVEVTSGSANTLYAGYAPAGAADGNQLTISGGTVAAAVAGSGSTSASSNVVEMNQGQVGTLIGGNSTAGAADNNILIINAGTITTSVAAGKAAAGSASGNTLDINGGTLGTTANSAADSNLIAGGYTDNGAANDNTVNVYAGHLGSMMSLYGGRSTTESTGNTLNLYAKDNTVKNLGYFQTLNFYVPEGTGAGETMLTVTDQADVSGAAINAGVQDTTKLSAGQVINLIYAPKGVTTNAATTYSVMDGLDKVTDAGFVQRTVLIKKQDPNTIVLYLPGESKPDLNPGTEVIADGQTNAAAVVSNGSDAAVTDGLQAALTAWAESHEAAPLREDAHGALSMVGSPYISSPAGMSLRQGPVMAASSPLDAADAKNANVTLSQEEDLAAREEREVEAKFTPYVMLGGHNLRYNSSSTVDTNGFNGELGFVKRVFKKDYADTIMPFIEYGTGSYTSYKNGSRGDGSQRYVGAGILLRRDHDNGLHYEGLVRVGRLMGDYAGSIGGYRTTYNSSANYFAVHAGLGKIFRQDSNDYNLYGKFFYSHLGGDSVTLRSSLGSADYSLSSVNSYWTRLGFRWTKHLDEDTTSFYAGLGWDYEFDGKATARYRDYTTPDASMKGSSEFLELGWQSKVTKENPWGADVRITGWHGVKQGFTYGVTITRRM